jgi:hypothetical protein
MVRGNSGEGWMVRGRAVWWFRVEEYILKYFHSVEEDERLFSVEIDWCLDPAPFWL